MIGVGDCMNDRCRVCDSERIAPNVRLGDGAGTTGVQVRAHVCADCGHMELQAENALDLYLAYTQSREATAAVPEGNSAPAPSLAPALNIQCPSCGSMLPAAAVTCEVCGWSQGHA
jgi:hypothetical protein